MVVELLLVEEVETMMRSGRKLNLGERWRRFFCITMSKPGVSLTSLQRMLCFFQLIPYVLLYYDVYFS